MWVPLVAASAVLIHAGFAFGGLQPAHDHGGQKLHRLAVLVLGHRHDLWLGQLDVAKGRP